MASLIPQPLPQPTVHMRLTPEINAKQMGHKARTRMCRMRHAANAGVNVCAAANSDATEALAESLTHTNTAAKLAQ